MSSKELSVYFNFQRNIKRIESHQDDELLADAYQIIPAQIVKKASVSRMQDGSQMAIDEAIVYEMSVFTELVTWFKRDYFEWYDKPFCEDCNTLCVFVRCDIGIKPGVDCVEVYGCPLCGLTAVFNRYNNTRDLLRSRKGRCHEHSQAFALFVKSLKYDARVVLDITDHVWIEIYSDLQKRWIHCDPSEGVLDKPLMYEKGWNKNLWYIIAFGDTGFQEVTWRYTTDHEYIKRRRDTAFDMEYLKSYKEHLALVLSRCTKDRKKYLLNRIIQELIELWLVIPHPDSPRYKGRQSGSTEWRVFRNEIVQPGTSSRVGHTIEFPPIHESDDDCDERDKKNEYLTYYLWYSTNRDYYLLKATPDVFINTHGWSSLTQSYSNIIRVIQSDSGFSYLTVEDPSQVGTISWRFDICRSEHLIHGVNILTNAEPCECGAGTITGWIETNGLRYKLEALKSPGFREAFIPSYYMTFSLEVNAQGCTDREKVRFARQKISEGTVPCFGLTFYLKKRPTL